MTNQTTLTALMAPKSCLDAIIQSESAAQTLNCPWVEGQECFGRSATINSVCGCVCQKRGKPHSSKALKSQKGEKEKTHTCTQV